MRAFLSHILLAGASQYCRYAAGGPFLVKYRSRQFRDNARMTDSAASDTSKIA